MTGNAFSDATDQRLVLERGWAQLNLRKRRLFATACASLAGVDFQVPELQKAIVVADAYADGLESDAALREQVSAVYGLPLTEPHFQDWIDASPINRAWYFSVVTCVGKLDDPVVITSRMSWQEGALVTNPYHLSVLHDLCTPPKSTHRIQPGALTQPTLDCARGIYSERMFTLLPTLADLVEADGCQDAVLLAHLRHDTFHVRGCWALDTVLGYDGDGG